MNVEPSLPRFKADVGTDGYRVVIPARRNWLAVVFLLAWLGGWAFGETDAIVGIVDGSVRSASGFVAFWLIGWTIAGLVVSTAIVWQLAGREVVTVGPALLMLRVEALGLGRARSFRMSDIRELRATEFGGNPFVAQRMLLPSLVGSGYGPVAFDYGARTIRFAPSLDEAEAKMLVRELRARLPAAPPTL